MCVCVCVCVCVYVCVCGCDSFLRYLCLIVFCLFFSHKTNYVSQEGGVCMCVYVGGAGRGECFLAGGEEGGWAMNNAISN